MIPLSKPVVGEPEIKNVRHVYHQYVVKLTNSFPMSRDAFMDYLSQNLIGTAVHYPLPIHLQPLYQNLGYERDLTFLWKRKLN